ncbi:aldo/keto reductase [Paractinoplanes rhizophilus]|uniref:Aldo/keto reductase n=1 Tax=Paractinoplanes rhizophilus TaxID=1416877 RepID=A0ABW2I343_9ACTN
MNRIGAGDLAVFPLALGASAFGWTSDESMSVQVLDAYAAAGGNFIDTADSYSAWVPGHSGGEAEAIVGRWMTARGNRDRVVVGTKVGRHPRFPGLSAAAVRAAADASLRRLRTDRIDICYAHADDRSVPIEETAEAFDALVRAGKVRRLGVSHYSAERIREWMRVARAGGLTPPAVMQPQYGLVRRDAGEQDLVAVAAAENLSVVPYFTSSSGFLTGQYRPEPALDGVSRPAGSAYFSHNGLWALDALETIAFARGVRPATVALAWVRTRPGVVAPIVNARTAQHLAGVLEAAALELSEDERAVLDEISVRVLD